MLSVVFAVEVWATDAAAVQYAAGLDVDETEEFGLLLSLVVPCAHEAATREAVVVVVVAAEAAAAAAAPRLGELQKPLEPAILRRRLRAVAAGLAPSKTVGHQCHTCSPVDAP